MWNVPPEDADLWACGNVGTQSQRQRRAKLWSEVEIAELANHDENGSPRLFSTEEIHARVVWRNRGFRKFLRLQGGLEICVPISEWRARQEQPE